MNVAGLGGTVVDVNVTLHGLSHSRPDDLDVMLVGPTGQAVLLLSDAGGDPDVVNLTLAFDDQAATTLPDANPTTSCLRKPTNSGAGDPFPAPASPAPPTLTPALSVFNGLPADGSWTFYVLDDAAGDAGSLAGGWTLELVMTPPPGPPTPPSANSYYRAPELNPDTPPNVVNLSASVAGNWRQGPSVSAPVHTTTPDGDHNLYFDGDLNPASDHNVVITLASGQTVASFAGVHLTDGYTGTVDFQCSAYVGTMNLTGSPTNGIAQNDPARYALNQTGGHVSVTSAFNWTNGSINWTGSTTKDAFFNLVSSAVEFAEPDGRTADLGSRISTLDASSLTVYCGRCTLSDFATIVAGGSSHLILVPVKPPKNPPPIPEPIDGDIYIDEKPGTRDKGGTVTEEEGVESPTDRGQRERGVLLKHEETPMARIRKSYTPEFKLQAVKMILEQKRAVAEAPRRLGVGANLRHLWKKAVLAQGPHAFPGSGHLAPQEDELRRLREENARLKMEPDVRTKATAFCASQSN